MSKINYMSGFRNTFSSEVEKDLLPKNQNSPQNAPKNLYAEQLSGSAFTAPRKENLRTWLYRKCPSVRHQKFLLDSKRNPRFLTENAYPEPNQLRWLPIEIGDAPHHFVDGICPILYNGSLNSTGSMISLYSATKDMKNEVFSTSDGELLIVPQKGGLQIHSEMGLLEVKPNEICLMPRGIRFQVKLKGKEARGYIIENFGAPFDLPDLGPIGANGLANPRHFLSPEASVLDEKGEWAWIRKYSGQIYKTTLHQSPLDVMAWWGNYYPYKYDLKLFNTINTVSFDHPDPSIFTVLTSQTNTPGVANVDFVIFPERWMVAEDTFRPPYYHRNIMSEYMGLIEGEYDAKEGGGFLPGGGSLHNQMSPHGPDSKTYESALKEELKPKKYEKTLAFMFESSLPYQILPQGVKQLKEDSDYLGCWQ